MLRLLLGTDWTANRERILTSLAQDVKQGLSFWGALCYTISKHIGGRTMLRLLLGTDWTANRERILTSLAQDVKQGKGNRILIVPELISHEAERQLCQAAGDTASRYAEVVSFTRLARRVSDWMHTPLQECLDDGGRVVAMAAAARQLSSRLKAYAAVETRPEFLTGSDWMHTPLQECLDDGGRVVAMAAAARQLSSRLKAYAAVETRPEFLTGLLDSIDEFKRCCITPQDLMQASGQTEGSLAQKLEELALLMEGYDSAAASRRRT